MLNSKEARTELGWSNKLTFDSSVQWRPAWYKNVNVGRDPLDETLKNIHDFESN